MKKRSSRKVSRTNWAKIDALRDDQIDYSDIPEQGKDFFKKAVLWLPQPKATLTIRLDRQVLDWFKAQGRGYQTRINALLREVPVRFRRGAVEAVSPAAVEELSPFCAVRSDDILTLARARFDVVHQRVAGALFPLFLAVDLPALRHEMPELLARLVDAEDEALRDPAIGPCGAYLVLRKRGGQASETTEISSPARSPSRTLPGS